MIKLISDGGPLFTIPLVLFFLTNVVLITRNATLLYSNKFDSIDVAKKSIEYIKYIGILAFSWGLLGQLIGLYSAFEFIQQSGGIDPKILMAGIRVSSITTVIGLSIFVISYAGWILLTVKMNRTLS
ncbi:MAG: MotA/TolQ/ExbB proton channel family protein [bacterium]|nr:MotA/TolQ/ExbB proton channel family protein [bacterium]